MGCQVSMLVRLPPPLRGRVGERGEPRALTDVMWRRHVNATYHIEGAR
jgi:hypothetical protein